MNNYTGDLILSFMNRERVVEEMKSENLQPKLHMIGNAHLDPVWLWQWQEGFAEIKATFRSALDRMNEFPDFIFTCAGAAYYEWVEQNCPEMFEEIRRRVHEGRWVVVGGWWIQPDCNLPSGESFVRHGLYSQRYFQEKFGVMSRVGYNVDSFGHHHMIPQILKKSGMDYYVFMRPEQHEKTMESNLFWWESQDGSRVMTFRIPFSYNNWSPRNYEDSVYGKALEVMEMAEAHKHNLMCFFGVGNHGGGPTIANVQSILRLQREHDKQIYRFSSPNEYFMEMENSYPELPVFTDDLQHHASGCYSAHSETKALNRKAEHRLLSAEKFSTLSHAIASFHYPASDIRRGWNNVMFNHFHDILGGCSIREAYDDAREAYGESLHLAAVSINAALQKISWSIDTMKDEIQSLSKDKDWVLWEQKDAGIPVVVFNPLSWEIEAPIQINKKVKGVTDDRGVSVEFQTVRGSRTNGSDDKYDTVFMGRIPALGYRVYWIYKEKVFSTPSPGRMLSVEEHALENDWYRLEIDAQTGHIRRLMDKKKGVEVFEGRSAVPIVIDEEHCDTWAHGVFDFRNEIGVFGNASIRLLEAGPLRAVLRVTNRYNGSSLRQDFILYRDKPNIEVRVKLDWHERHKMLKLSFPVAVDGPIATYEIPYGYLERETNGEEEPGQQWVDVTGKPKNRDIETYGVTLINDSKYSFDVKNNDLRMTVVRSPIFADHYGERDEFCEYMDQGVQEFLYALVPHEGDWRKGKAPMNSYELNVPPVTIIETYHKGTLPQTLEGVKITADNLIVTAFKKAESGDGYILRCYETDGRDGRTEIELPFLNRRWTMAYGKCEIKTVWIPADSTKEIVEVNMIEMQM